MEETVQQLVTQVQVLTQTVETMIQRSEQLFKMQEEKGQALLETATKLQGTIDNLEVTDEALKQALNEVDRQIDDLAKVTAAQLAMYQSQQQQQTNAQ